MKNTLRSFIAIDVKDSSILSNISKVQERVQANFGPLKLVDLSIIHITVIFLGNISLSQAEQLYSFINTKINPLLKENPLSLTLRGLSSFNGRVFFINLEGDLKELEKIRNLLKEKIDEIGGIPYDKKPFRPHLTIARAKRAYSRGRSSRQDPSFQSRFSSLEEEYRDFVFGKISINEIYLKKSTLTPNGPIYENLSF